MLDAGGGPVVGPGVAFSTTPPDVVRWRLSMLRPAGRGLGGTRSPRSAPDRVRPNMRQRAALPPQPGRSTNSRRRSRPPHTPPAIRRSAPWPPKRAHCAVALVDDPLASALPRTWEPCLDPFANTSLAPYPRARELLRPNRKLGSGSPYVFRPANRPLLSSAGDGTSAHEPRRSPARPTTLG